MSDMRYIGTNSVLPRRAAELITQAMADTRVILVNGARQCGKSTLVGQIGKSVGAQWRSLDRAETRQAAIADPTDFVSGAKPMIIDEVQRVPDLMLAIKESVDREPFPGAFLLTGSARVLGLRAVPDALPGRMETIELWPLSQGEIDRQSDRFIDDIFEQGSDFVYESTEKRTDYIDRLVRGGFPEAVIRAPKRRERFFDSYVSDLINRDVIQLSEFQRGAEMRALIKLIAARSGQLLVLGSLASELGIPQPTIKRYISLLEDVFLIKRIPAWSRNISSRAVSKPKVAVVDSGVAANILGQDSRRLQKPESPFGPLLEGFVTMEIARQITWSQQRVEQFHYRTKDQVEVDIVLENRQGEVVAIDVKAASTVRSDDFNGIRHLSARIGNDFKVGVVLYTGQQTLPFGPKLRAIPISSLWHKTPWIKF